MLLLNGQRLTLDEIERVAQAGDEVGIAPEALVRMAESRAVVVKIVEDGRVVYGVNTGFGKLSDIHIPPKDLEKLQLNLVRSHCCGVGNSLSEAETRAMLLLRANVLAKGLSGARAVVAETLVAMLNNRIHPIIPEKGSVGASGDLAPLAHLTLSAIGEGECWHTKGTRRPSIEALGGANIQPLALQAKEGLALLNGTQAMCSVGGLALWRAQRLAETADKAGAMTLEALLGTPVAFDARIHEARGHQAQVDVAANLRHLLRESEIRNSHLEGDARVQDAYSLRCIPQVHGAVRMALSHAREVIEIETAAATDNPLVFTDTDEVLSGGNFHGAPIAYVLDYAAMALTDLMSISERRIDRLVNPDLNEGLPPFLSRHPGTGSGYMIAHVTAVALLNEAKILAHPACIDNLPTSGGKEDHVSMGMTSALKLRAIVELAGKVLAIELMAAAEGLEHRKPLRPGLGVLAAYEEVRGFVSPLIEDRVLSDDIERLATHLP